MARSKRNKAGATAFMIFTGSDIGAIGSGVSNILQRGGAVMFGQTRDQEKLIVTVYLDGDKDQEYAECAEDVEKFLAEFQV